MMIYKFSGIQRQLAVAGTCALSMIILGNLLGWPAPTLKKLREPDSEIHLSLWEEVWVVNAFYVTTLMSPFPCGVLMNVMGRKTTLLIANVFAAASWALTYFGRTGTTLLIARGLAGIMSGGAITVTFVYVAEIAEPRVRGIAGTLMVASIFLGTIFVYLFGPYVSIQTMAAISGMLPLVFFLFFSLCPESPYYYVMRGRHADAERALAWLRGGTPIENELAAIQTSIERERKAGQGYFAKMLSLITVPAHRKAFIIVEVLAFLQRFSGFSSLATYSTVVLPPRLGPLTVDHCTLIMGVVWLVSSLCCSAFIDRVGRKPLLYFSSIGFVVSMLPTAIWYYLDRETSTDVTGVNWVPFAGFIGFGVALTGGLGSIAPIYNGELFPSRLKGQASAFTTIVGAASSAISIAMFPFLAGHVGLYVNFLVYAAMGPVTGVFTYFYVIETKGKSLQMIQAKLNGEEIREREENGKK